MMKLTLPLIAFVALTTTACMTADTSDDTNLVDNQDVTVTTDNGQEITITTNDATIEDSANPTDDTFSISASPVSAPDEIVMEEAPRDASMARYVDYSSPLVASELTADRQVVLFFYADRCPTCRSAQADILANIDQLPNDVTVLKVDYDAASTQMRQRYGVTTQHTFVHIDSNQDPLTTYVGGAVDEIIALFE
jgi:thiol-disulfide isomerase/thioredoxin